MDALWLNPVLLNDQPKASYHGYAVTDHYQVDPRLGGNAAYRDMVAGCHEKDIRVIQDVIFNHWGHNHWMVRELPDSSWLHQWPEFTLTNYNCNLMTDPNAVPEEVAQFNKGWFVPQMPDLAPDRMLGVQPFGTGHLHLKQCSQHVGLPSGECEGFPAAFRPA